MVKRKRKVVQKTAKKPVPNFLGEGDKIGMSFERKVQVKKYEPATIGFWGETTIKKGESTDHATKRLEAFLDGQMNRKIKQITNT